MPHVKEMLAASTAAALKGTHAVTISKLSGPLALSDVSTSRRVQEQWRRHTCAGIAQEQLHHKISPRRMLLRLLKRLLRCCWEALLAGQPAVSR